MSRMRKHLSLRFVWTLALLTVLGSAIGAKASAEEPTERPVSPNVLFFAVDDTRDWVNCLGGYQGAVHTPNIDRRAKRSMLFTNAHYASSKCVPSPGAVAGASLNETDAPKRGKRLNVLFIAVDDLRPTLGCYGDEIAVTPNMDRLASRGALFRRAYCQQAVCNPSRASLMTGRRPDTIRVWDLKSHFRETLPDVVTLPQCFKHQGYHTRSIGKIYHGVGKPSRDPVSWSVAPQYDEVLTLSLRYAKPKNRNQAIGLHGSATESAEVRDNAYTDGLVCDAAEAALEELKTRHKPFFLAVGFRKPHLPFCAPRRYWDLYNRSKIPAPAPDKHPADAPELAVRSWKELEAYTDIPNDGRLSTEKIRELRHGYYVCVSFTDALVGRLLDQLDRLKLAESTVVILWGDHGYHLGEQGLWTKANNYDLNP
ncbi:MAG: sulfatase [Pirellulales bacterium]|nr:sulfatase [Pirellulales bacterium]